MAVQVAAMLSTAKTVYSYWYNPRFHFIWHTTADWPFILDNLAEPLTEQYVNSLTSCLCGYYPVSSQNSPSLQMFMYEPSNREVYTIKRCMWQCCITLHNRKRWRQNACKMELLLT